MDELILGQIVALALGFLFAGMEYLRLKRLSLALLEGSRFWAFVSAAELTVWFAVGSNDMVGRVGIAALGAILAALIINNIYLFAHRSLTDNQ